MGNWWRATWDVSGLFLITVNLPLSLSKMFFKKKKWGRRRGQRHITCGLWDLILSVVGRHREEFEQEAIWSGWVTSRTKAHVVFQCWCGLGHVGLANWRTGPSVIVRRMLRAIEEAPGDDTRAQPLWRKGWCSDGWHQWGCGRANVKSPANLGSNCNSSLLQGSSCTSVSLSAKWGHDCSPHIVMWQWDNVMSVKPLVLSLALTLHLLHLKKKWFILFLFLVCLWLLFFL